MVVQTSDTAPILVQAVQHELYPAEYGSLGMTFAPGKKQAQSMTGCQWDRDLDTDLARMVSEYKSNALVSLMTDNEYKTYQIAAIFDKCKEHGIEPIPFPIIDGSTPDTPEDMMPLVEQITELLKQKKNVVVHCLGGLGRTGLVVACVLLYILKVDAQHAISITRKARKGTIQTARQVLFVEKFAEFNKA